MLSVNWKDVLTAYPGRPRVKDIAEPHEFREMLNGLCASVCNDALALKAQNRGDDSIKQEIAARVTQGRFNIEAINSAYVRVTSEHAWLASQQKQVVWADFWEKTRYLMFRVLTTIGIAAIVLLTAALAHWWEIPLPMLSRVVPPFSS